jgi:hypothetical protein
LALSFPWKKEKANLEPASKTQKIDENCPAPLLISIYVETVYVGIQLVMVPYIPITAKIPIQISSSSLEYLSSESRKKPYYLPVVSNYPTLSKKKKGIRRRHVPVTT